MKFKSNDFVFRPTVLGDAFRTMADKMGLEGTIPFVRESKFHGLLRDKKDRDNIRPSRHVDIHPVVKPAGAFGKELVHG